MAWRESNLESQGCDTKKVIVLATAADGTTTNNSAVLKIPPTGHLLPHSIIPVKALGTMNEAEMAPKVGPNNLPDSGGLENEIGVKKEKNQDKTQTEFEEEAVGSWEMTREERTTAIHGNLQPDIGADLPDYRITEADC